ncbi:MAG: hypothetical protein KatS3mg131_3922 [Candidatus Tectimicrobiota bacterium]|nr:MAG: hypothetical protein KatS3mg131_3922 [Candidatus Tectomicrobia bacterium]
MRDGLATALALGILVATAWGNGGTPRLVRAAAGPYLVSVWTHPATPRVGEQDVSVAVMRPADGAPLLDAAVRLTATLEGSAAPVTAVAAPGAGGNRLLFHAALPLPVPGAWHVTVAVSGAAGTGQAAFVLEVQPRRQPWGLLGAAGAGLALCWLAWRWRRAGRAR